MRERLLHGHNRDFVVPKCTSAGARNAKAASAMRVGAGDIGIGGHPVRRVGHALLGRENREEGSEGVEGETLPIGEPEVLALQLEPGPCRVIADHRLVRGDDVDAEIVEGEGVHGIGE